MSFRLFLCLAAIALLATEASINEASSNEESPNTDAVDAAEAATLVSALPLSVSIICAH